MRVAIYFTCGKCSKYLHFEDTPATEILSVQELDRDLLRQVRKSSQEGFDLLGINSKSAPLEILTGIENVLKRAHSAPAEIAEIVDLEDLPVMLGTAWGQQLVRELQWMWFEVQIRRQDGVSLAVMPEDQALAIFPIDYLEAVIAGEVHEPRMVMSFELLQENSIPSQPGERLNIMDGIYPIVPDSAADEQ